MLYINAVINDNDAVLAIFSDTAYYEYPTETYSGDLIVTLFSTHQGFEYTEDLINRIFYSEGVTGLRQVKEKIQGIVHRTKVTE
jgi:hypothetical protein